MQESSIIVETSTIYVHEQNENAERMNRTISDMAWTMTVKACLPETVWRGHVEQSVIFGTAWYHDLAEIRHQPLTVEMYDTPNRPAWSYLPARILRLAGITLRFRVRYPERSAFLLKLE